jgi:hypothetical protein
MTLSSIDIDRIAKRCLDHVQAMTMVALGARTYTELMVIRRNPVVYLDRVYYARVNGSDITWAVDPSTGLNVAKAFLSAAAPIARWVVVQPMDRYPISSISKLGVPGLATLFRTIVVEILGFPCRLSASHHWIVFTDPSLPPRTLVNTTSTLLVRPIARRPTGSIVLRLN